MEETLEYQSLTLTTWKAFSERERECSTHLLCLLYWQRAKKKSDCEKYLGMTRIRSLISLNLFKAWTKSVRCDESQR